MPNLTIAGHVFDVSDDPRIVPGATMTEGHVHTLQQTRRENIRNNFAMRVKNLGDEPSAADLEKLQSDLNEYAEKYEFGVRQAGSGRRVVDPVEKEMLRLAKEAIATAYFAKNGERITGAALTEAAEKLLEARGEDYAKRAKRAIREREQAAEAILQAA